MKIIFLDIDGVLNVYPQGHDEYGAIFHPHLVENLKLILDRTGAKIVVSSTWRRSGLSIMKEMWEKRGLPGEVIDITPFETDVVERGTCEFYDQVDRGFEIQQWIDDNQIQDFVILDDDNDIKWANPTIKMIFSNKNDQQQTTAIANSHEQPSTTIPP